MKGKLTKGTRTTSSDVSAAGAGGKPENPPVITKEAGTATKPHGRPTGGGKSSSKGGY